MNKIFERGAIEAAPLAYMHGRTVNQRFIILDKAQKTLRDVKGIAFTQFMSQDVVRQPLVQKIIHAYERSLSSAVRKSATHLSDCFNSQSQVSQQ